MPVTPWKLYQACCRAYRLEGLATQSMGLATKFACTCAATTPQQPPLAPRGWMANAGRQARPHRSPALPSPVCMVTPQQRQGNGSPVSYLYRHAPAKARHAADFVKHTEGSREASWRAAIVVRHTCDDHVAVWMMKDGGVGGRGRGGGFDTHGKLLGLATLSRTFKRPL
eukprot:365277-Chlamydomonas_euryale.AAC.5